MTKLRMPLHQDPWSLLELPESLVVTWLEPNYTHWKELYVLGNAVKNVARFVKMFIIQILFEVV